MKLTYLIAILFVSVIILGCSAKETQPANEQATAPTTAQPSVPAAAPVTTPTAAASTAGKVLIADTENQRVIEIDKNTKEVTWQYGCSKLYSSGRCDSGNGADQLKQPTSAVYDGSYILISDSGNDRVIKVNWDKTTMWTYSTDLDIPTFAVAMKNENVLITDSISNRVSEVNHLGEVVWQYGCARLTNTQKCAAGKNMNELNVPNAAIELSNGNILISDKGNNRIIEVTKDKETVFEYKSGLSFPGFAEAYNSGYVIANTNANKIAFVDNQGVSTNEFKFVSHPLYVEFNNDKALITDSFNNRILETDSDGNILWYYGDCTETDGQPDAPCTIGSGASQLFKPSTAVLG